MKRTDIPVREPVAYHRGKSGYPEPIIVLDTEKLWTQSRTAGFGTRDGKRVFRRTSDNRYSDSSYGFGGAGILAVTLRTYPTGVDDVEKASLAILRESIETLPEEITEDAIEAWRNEGHPYVELRLLNNRWIFAPWAEALREFNLRREQDMQLRRAERDVKERHDAEVRSIRHMLDSRAIEHGAFAVYGSTTRTEIDTAALVALLSRIHVLEDERPWAS